MEKDYIKLISAFEQAGANLGPFASMLASYHVSLCQSGFQRQEALELVIGMQNLIFNKVFDFSTSSNSDSVTEK